MNLAEISPVRIGVIGGSGLYSMEGLTEIERVRVSTPFGEPPDPIVIGRLSGERFRTLWTVKMPCWDSLCQKNGRSQSFSVAPIAYAGMLMTILTASWGWLKMMSS